MLQLSSVQLLSQVRLFATPCTIACQATLSITNSQSLLRLVSIEVVMPSNHSIFCCPLLLLPSIFPSIRVFSSESILYIRWPKCWSFSISTSNEYSGLISFRIDWFDLLAVQGTLKSLLQHWTSKTSVLWCWTFFMVQLSHQYMTAGKPWLWLYVPLLGFPCGSVGKESTCNARDLGWEHTLEKGKATHSSILAWRIPWTV